MAVSVTGPRAVNELGGPVIPGRHFSAYRPNSMMIKKIIILDTGFEMVSSLTSHLANLFVLQRQNAVFAHFSSNCILAPHNSQ